MSFPAEFWSYLRARRKLWMLPILIAMLLFAVLMILAQGTAISPFIYTLF